MVEILRPTRVEMWGLLLTALLSGGSYVFGYPGAALGALVGGLVVVINYTAIRVLVAALVGGGHSKGFGIFAVLLKLAVLVLIVLAVFVFAKINIYGFLIGAFGVVLVIIAEGLAGTKDASL